MVIIKENKKPQLFEAVASESSCVRVEGYFGDFNTLAKLISTAPRFEISINHGFINKSLIEKLLKDIKGNSSWFSTEVRSGVGALTPIFSTTSRIRLDEYGYEIRIKPAVVCIRYDIIIIRMINGEDNAAFVTKANIVRDLEKAGLTNTEPGYATGTWAFKR